MKSSLRLKEVKLSRRSFAWKPEDIHGEDTYLDTRKKTARLNTLAHRRIFDQEFLGAKEGKAEGESWDDVIVDKPLDINPEFKFNLRLMGPCPEGFKRHYCWLEGSEIKCVNPLTRKIETIDAENEVWIEKEDTKKFPVFLSTPKSTTVQYGDIGKDHFFVWDRTENENPAPIEIYDKSAMELQWKISEFPLPEDYYYAKLFSVKNQLFLQSRMRPWRDNVDYIWNLPDLDNHDVHKDLETQHKKKYYKPESVYSNLFYYHFEQKTWYLLPNSKFFSCSMIAKSEDEKQVYFLSKLNQGYVLDTSTWKVTPLHSIGRPGNISDGCTSVHFGNTIVAVGGGWPTYDTSVDSIKILGTLRPKVSRIANILNKYSPRILVFDLKSMKWSVPVIESDSMNSWEPIAFSCCIPYKDKIFIIGGENKKGELKKVWVLESQTKVIRKSKQEKPKSKSNSDTNFE
jgi:hypothetical protein